MLIWPPLCVCVITRYAIVHRIIVTHRSNGVSNIFEHTQLIRINKLIKK